MKEKIHLLIKLVVIGFLALVLLIPLALVRSLIEDRESFREEAMTAVSRSWANQQSLTGPVLVIPYERTEEVKVWDEKKRVETTKTQVYQHLRYITPETFKAVAQLTTEERYKGIYSFPVYQSDLKIEGTIRIENIVQILEEDSLRFDHRPYMILGIEDPRGIRSVPSMSWQGEWVEFSPGCRNRLPNGIHVELPFFRAEDEGTVIPFSFSLELHGMGSFRVTPVGKNAEIRFDSTWPHPSFSGPFPAVETSISDDGFSSRWQVSHFATNLGRITSLDNLEQQSVGVDFYNPVDIYQITDRSVKYGFLFVFLTFVVFFLFEILQNIKIHPIPYGLVGIALALFFMLLLSLSEHIAFVSAYWLSAGACIGLLTFYVSHVMRSSRRGLVFAAILSLIYLALFCILQLQDYALLTGTLLLFLVLGVIMFLTRHLDWHQVGTSKSQPPDLPEPKPESEG